MPPAARNLFVKRFMDFQKLFIMGTNGSKHRKMHQPCKIKVFGPTFLQKGGPPEAPYGRFWIIPHSKIEKNLL